MTEELKPEAAPVEPVAWMYTYPNGKSYVAIEREPLCQREQTQETLLYAHPPAAPTDALVKALNGYLSDCTNDECERCQNARAALAGDSHE